MNQDHYDLYDMAEELYSDPDLRAIYIALREEDNAMLESVSAPAAELDGNDLQNQSGYDLLNPFWCCLTVVVGLLYISYSSFAKPALNEASNAVTETNPAYEVYRNNSYNFNTNASYRNNNSNSSYRRHTSNTNNNFNSNKNYKY